VKARLWSVGLALLFGVVLVWYLYYTHQLVSAVNANAVAVSRMYARVAQGLNSPEESELIVLLDLIQEIKQLGMPMVVINAAGEPTAAENLPFASDLRDPEGRERVLAYAARLDERNAPIIQRGVGEIHFGMPSVVERLRWVPYIQAATLIVIVFTAIWILRSTARAEQERVWATMARESAHQLGTPISSLSGWVEILRMPHAERADVAPDPRIAREVEVDVERLNKVAQRFELIGRPPKLERVDLHELFMRLEDYFCARLPRMDRSIRLDVDVPKGLSPVAGNPVLLEWAFENIIKNSIDVLAGRGGHIEVKADLSEDGRVRIRFLDDGPGVAPELRKTLFDPGVSGKQGGWGVGLSLTRRIVKATHGGTIELGRQQGGAEFIVKLPVMPPERAA
jgi:signal transduction histidine kinase